MSTNNIGEGTVNTTINLIIEECQVYGQMAIESDRSKAALLKDLILEGLKVTHPEIAAQVIEMRRQRRDRMVGFR